MSWRPPEPEVLGVADGRTAEVERLTKSRDELVRIGEELGKQPRAVWWPLSKAIHALDCRLAVLQGKVQ
jgi:hypothetical protein